MKSIVITCIFLLSASWVHAQESNYGKQAIEEQSLMAVQAQLKAYNSKDLEAFLKVFSDSVEVYNYPNTIRTRGKDALRETFSDFFERSGKLNSQIMNRIVTGNVVIDQELVTGYSKEENGAFNVTAIYTVKDELITEIRFIYPQ